MKKSYLIIIFCLFSTALFAQIKMPSKQQTPKSNTSTAKTNKKEEKKEKQEYRGLTQTLKLTSDAACKFYVDGEYSGIINPDQILKIELKKGEYQFRAVNIENDADVWQELYSVTEVNTEKLFSVGIMDVINKRLREEEYALEAKRRAEQAEIERIKMEEQVEQEKINKQNKYKEYLSKANDYLLDNNYSSAEQYYKLALSLDPSSEDAKIGIENVTYKLALKNDTEEWYESFIAYYPKSKFIGEIKNKLEIKKEDNAYKKAKNSNQMEDFETYVNQYPNGKYTSEFKTIIENSYFQWGQNSYNSGNYKDSQGQLNNYLNRYPYGTHALKAKELKTKVDRKVRALNRENFAFFDYALTKKANIGISFGTYNQRKLGYYFTTRINTDLFTDNLYNTDDVPSSYIANRSELREGKLDAVLGLTYGVFHPFWLYTGIGFGWYPTFSNYDSYDGETEWVRNSSKINDNPITMTRNGQFAGYDSITEANRSRAPFLQEFGLAIAFTPLNFSAGVCLINYKEVSMMFSAGFTITR